MNIKIYQLCLKYLIILSVLLSKTLSAQDLKTDSIALKMHSNAIYGSIGVNLEVLGVAWFTTTLYYERMFQKNAQKSNVSTFLRAGYGGMAGWDETSSYILAQLGLLTGLKKHHLEASIGAVVSLNSYYDIFPVSGNIGYRMQKAQGHFIFRTGLAWPETFYIGIGGSF